MFSSLLAWLRHLRFLQLTVFFVFVLLTLPLRIDHPLFNIAVQLLLFNIFAVTLSASGSKRWLRWLLMGFWTLAEVLYLRMVFVLGPGDHHEATSVVIVCFLAMMAVCVIAILPYIFRTRQISLDTIFAAVMSYFLIISIFANLYSLLYLGNPHTFNLGTTGNPDQFYSLYTEMIYFGLITIVGVGYGDIVPLLPFPRMLAAVEGVLGHFYIAVFVAWLVGTFISQSLQRREQMAPQENKEPMED
jgi:hypothetical protein